MYCDFDAAERTREIVPGRTLTPADGAAASVRASSKIH